MRLGYFICCMEVNPYKHINSTDSTNKHKWLMVRSYRYTHTDTQTHAFMFEYIHIIADDIFLTHTSVMQCQLSLQPSFTLLAILPYIHTQIQTRSQKRNTHAHTRTRLHRSLSLSLCISVSPTPVVSVMPFRVSHISSFSALCLSMYVHSFRSAQHTSCYISTTYTYMQ